MAGSKRITGQEALDEGRQRHGTATGIPAVAAWDPAPTLHLQLGFGAWEALHPVAVLGISRLLRALDWLRTGLGAQGGDKEGGWLWVFAQGCRKAPGGSRGVAVVVEVEMRLRDAWKAGEGEDGAGGQGGGRFLLLVPPVSQRKLRRLWVTSPESVTKVVICSE